MSTTPLITTCVLIGQLKREPLENSQKVVKKLTQTDQKLCLSRVHITLTIEGLHASDFLGRIVFPRPNELNFGMWPSTL